MSENDKNMFAKLFIFGLPLLAVWYWVLFPYYDFSIWKVLGGLVFTWLWYLASKQLGKKLH